MTAMRRIGAIAAAAVVVVAAVWYLALFRPESAKLTAAHKAHAAAELQKSDLEKQVVQLKALERQIPHDRAELATLRKNVPDNPSLPAVLAQLHTAASASGVELTSVGPNPVATASSSSAASSGPQSITLSMTATGSYPQMVQFFDLLATMPRTVVLDTVSINNSSANSVSASLSGRIFYADAPSGS